MPRYRLPGVDGRRRFISCAGGVGFVRCRRFILLLSLWHPGMHSSVQMCMCECMHLCMHVYFVFIYLCCCKAT